MAFTQGFTAAYDARVAQFTDALTLSNNRYSGNLPRPALTDDAGISRIYFMSILSLLATERVGIFPAVGCPGNGNRVWLTGGAENTTTNSFFWDHAFVATALVMLDPVTIKCMLTAFLQQAVGGYDPTAGWGIDWESGHAVGMSPQNPLTLYLFIFIFHS